MSDLVNRKIGRNILIILLPFSFFVNFFSGHGTEIFFLTSLGFFGFITIFGVVWACLFLVIGFNVGEAEKFNLYILKMFRFLLMR